MYPVVSHLLVIVFTASNTHLEKTKVSASVIVCMPGGRVEGALVFRYAHPWNIMLFILYLYISLPVNLHLPQCIRTEPPAILNLSISPRHL
jgi:hypothetical protein